MSELIMEKMRVWDCLLYREIKKKGPTNDSEVSYHESDYQLFC